MLHHYGDSFSLSQGRMHRRAGKAPRHDVLMELPRSAGPSGRHTPLAPLSLPPAQPQPPQHTIQPPAAALPPPSQAPGWPLLLALRRGVWLLSSCLTRMRSSTQMSTGIWLRAGQAMSFTALMAGGDEEVAVGGSLPPAPPLVTALAPPAALPSQVQAQPLQQPLPLHFTPLPQQQPVPPPHPLPQQAGGLAGRPLGQALQLMARDLLGQAVLRHWPEEGGWFRAFVVDFFATSREWRATAHGTTQASRDSLLTAAG